MRLYPKKLNNIEELNAEKQLLQSQIEQIDPDGWFSLKVKDKASAAANTDTKQPFGGSIVNSLLDAGGIDMLLQLLPLFKSKTKKKEPEKNKEDDKPNLLIRAGVEFVGGYLKWKAIELSYKGLKKILTKRNKKA